MARAVFGGGLSPYITKAQDRPTPYNPLGALSTAIRQPFVEDVIVPGISRIRDEMRIAEQEEQIAAQAEAKRAAAAQFLQQAAAAEQQGLDAEVAAAVSGVDVPMVSDGSEYSTPLSNLATGLRNITAPAGMYEDMQSRYIKGFDAGLDLRETAYDAVGEEIAGPFDHHGEASLRAAMMLERELAAIKRGPSASGARKEGGSLEKAQRIAKGLRDRGLGDIVAEIVQGATAEEAFMAAGQQLQQTQQRRGEQEATTAATQRFGQALVGGVPQAAAQEAQAAMDIRRGVPAFATGAPSDDPNRLATRAYRDYLEDNPGDTQGAMAAAQQAYGASAPQPAAQEAQAIQQPQLIEQANRLRQQATDMEREATGIEGTPVYRTFGDHAMPFLDALDSGDVATQMALMESVGGSTDYQPFGKGAMGKAMGKDASMRARRDLLDLKKNYLKAKRREDTALKLIKAKEKKPKAKRTGGGGGYGKKDQERLRILGNLNNDAPLSDKDKVTLEGLGLTSGEISRIKPGSAGRESWTAITRGMGKRAYSRAQNIMRGQATPEEIGDDKARADERAATVLENQARRTDNQAEKKRLEGLAADIRADAATRAREKENRAAVARLQTRLAAAEKDRNRQQGVLDLGGAMNGAGVWVKAFDPNAPDAELNPGEKNNKDSVKARLESSKAAVKAITDAIDKITPATAD